MTLKELRRLSREYLPKKYQEELDHFLEEIDISEYDELSGGILRNAVSFLLATYAEDEDLEPTMDNLNKMLEITLPYEDKVPEELVEAVKRVFSGAASGMMARDSVITILENMGKDPDDYTVIPIPGSLLIDALGLTCDKCGKCDIPHYRRCPSCGDELTEDECCKRPECMN